MSEPEDEQEGVAKRPPRRVEEGTELDLDIRKTFTINASPAPEEGSRWTVNGVDWKNLKIELDMRFAKGLLPDPPEDK